MAFDIIVMCAAKCGSKGCMGTKGKQPLRFGDVCYLSRATS